MAFVNSNNFLVMSFVALCFFFSATETARNCVDTETPCLIVLSFDGFRDDYISKDNTPNLLEFKEKFASAKYLQSVFPTKTFVNHFSIATGLQPEDHGVLDNTMFDKENKPMNITYEQYHADEDVVPIWIEHEFPTNDRHSGVSMWPGSQFAYKNRHPTYHEEYEKDVDMRLRVDQFMSWISNEEKPASFVMAYFDEPDRVGHRYGVESEEIKDSIRQVDNIFGYVLEQLENAGLADKVNLIVLSDHGMRTITYKDIIKIENLVSEDLYKSVITGVNAFILPNEGQLETVYKEFKKVANSDGNIEKFSVFKQDDIPEDWHIKNSPRLNGKLYLVSKPGKSFFTSLHEKILEEKTEEEFKIGIHGYDNKDETMRTIFMAKGPMFKESTESSEPISTIEVYPLFKHLLDLDGKASPKQPDRHDTHVMRQLLRDDAKTDNEADNKSTSVNAGLDNDANLLLNPDDIIVMKRLLREVAETYNEAQKKSTSVNLLSRTKNDGPTAVEPITVAS